MSSLLLQISCSKKKTQMLFSEKQMVVTKARMLCVTLGVFQDVLGLVCVCVSFPWSYDQLGTVNLLMCSIRPGAESHSSVMCVFSTQRSRCSNWHLHSLPSQGRTESERERAPERAIVNRWQSSSWDAVRHTKAWHISYAFAEHCLSEDRQSVGLTHTDERKLVWQVTSNIKHPCYVSRLR